MLKIHYHHSMMMTVEQKHWQASWLLWTQCIYEYLQRKIGITTIANESYITDLNVIAHVILPEKK